MKLTELFKDKARVPFWREDIGTIFLVYETPWNDPDFQKRHQRFLDARFMKKKGRKVIQGNFRSEELVKFAKEQLVEVQDANGKPFDKEPGWKDALPSVVYLSTAPKVFEETDAEADEPDEEDVLKKSKGSSKSTASS